MILVYSEIFYLYYLFLLLNFNNFIFPPYEFVHLSEGYIIYWLSFYFIYDIFISFHLVV